MSKGWQGGSTAAWRRTREYVLARDGHRCQLQLEGCTTKATHVHHVVAREVAGDDASSLVASCAWCNLSTGDPRKHDPKPRVRAWW